MIGKTLAHYEILEPLGAGGMGEVYRARDLNLERDVAIKVLPDDVADDPERLTRFEREAKLLASLSHANIAAIYGLEESEGQRFIAMELIEGESLGQRLGGPQPLTVEDALEIARQIAKALDAAHSSGVIHRDLKPANVMLTPEGHVKVLDFGLAKAYEADGSRPGTPDMSDSPTIVNATRTGMILGTAAYMSPEQASGLPIDKRTDIWAFGVILFEMLTGGRLFQGETASHVLADVLKTDPDLGELPDDTPVAIRRLVRRCLQKKPAHRLHDIADAGLEIDDAIDGEDTDDWLVSAWLEGPRSESSPWRTALPWAVAAIATVVAFGAVGFGAGGSGSPTERPARTLAVSVDGMFGTGSLSPDGSMLAYWGPREATGTVMIHDLETGQSRAVYETEGVMAGYSPGFSWSPDSRSILVDYLTRGDGPDSLRGSGSARFVAVSVSNGSARSVLEGENVEPIWLDNETLVFASAAGIERLPLSGGERRVLVPTDTEPPADFPAAFADFWHDAFDLRPLSGGGFLYRRIALGGESVFHFDGAESRPVAGAVMGNFRGQWTYVDGFLLFIDGSDLMAQPLDPAAPASDISPVRIAVGVRRFTVSAEGTLIYEVVPPPEDTEFDVVWVDRGGRITGTIAAFPGQFVRDLRLSPDGTRLALAAGARRSSAPGAQYQVWVYDVEGVEAPVLLRGDELQGVYGWTPDGSRVAIARNSATTTTLRLENAMGRGGAGNAVDAAEGAWFSLAPDGESVVVERSIRETEPTLFTRDPDGSFTTSTTPLPVGANSFAISPNGRCMAYLEQDPVSNEPVVWLALFPDGGAARRIATGTGPTWSRDGTELFFGSTSASEERFLMALPVDPERGAPTGPPEPLFSLDQAGGGATLLPGGFSAVSRYDVAPDGQRFAMSRRTSDTESKLFLVQNWKKALLGATEGR